VTSDDIGALVQRVLRGDRRAVARALSLVEAGSGTTAALSASLFAHTGGAHVIGLTGPPGAGKSSLVAELVTRARAEDHTVGVIAVDPSSPYSGGALLGDRLRMDRHEADPKVFVRSMASRGHLGGLAAATREAVRVLDASGADVIFVETVGVGQSEVEVAGATDTVVVMVGPGFGDAVQAAKAGVLEIADVFAVNKADLPGSDDAARHLRGNLELGRHEAWVPPVLLTSVVEQRGVDELWGAIGGHRRHLEGSLELRARRQRQLIEEVEDLVVNRLRRQVGERLAVGDSGELTASLVERVLDPYAAAARLAADLLGDEGGARPELWESLEA